MDSFSWNSSYLGRLTLQDWLGLPVASVLGTLMALFMFWDGGTERIGGRLKRAGGCRLGAGPQPRVLISQPSTADKWQALAPERAAAVGAACRFTRRTFRCNDALKVFMLDVRAGRPRARNG